LIASTLRNVVTAERVAQILFNKELITLNTLKQHKYKLTSSKSDSLNQDEIEKLCENILKEKNGTNALRWLKDRLEEVRSIIFGDELMGIARHEMVVFPELDSGVVYLEKSINMQKLINLLDIKQESENKSKWILFEHIAAEKVQNIAEIISCAMKNFKKPLTEKEEFELLKKQAKEIDDFMLMEEEEDEEEQSEPAVKKSKLESKTKSHTLPTKVLVEQQEIEELDRMFGGKTKKRKL